MKKPGIEIPGPEAHILNYCINITFNDLLSDIIYLL